MVQNVWIDLPHFFFLPAVQNFGVALKGFWCDCKGVQGNNICLRLNFLLSGWTRTKVQV